ncbi:MAG: Ig-like domain-containing protein [Dethiobacteria bacterium]
MRKFYYILILSLALLALMPQPAQASVTFTALAASADITAGTVTVTGQVSSGSSTGISIQITDTNGSQLYSGNTSPTADGSFTLTCSLGINESASYLVKATADNGDMPAFAFLVPDQTPAADQDKKEDPNRLMPVVVPLQAPPTVTIMAPTNNAKVKTGTAITISASGTNCDHMAACYKDPTGKVTWLGVQNGNSYSASFTPQVSGTYTITVAGRNTPKDTDPGSLGVSTSCTIAAELSPPTVTLINPSDTFGGVQVPPGTITISAAGTGCHNMEAVIVKNNQSKSLGVQLGNRYQATITETGKTDILVIVYGRNSANSTDPGYKQVQKSAYIYVRP